jgi:hypothetical protein
LNWREAKEGGKLKYQLNGSHIPIYTHEFIGNEMKFHVENSTLGYTRFDYNMNLDIMEELNTQPIVKSIENYKTNCKKKLFRMPRS